MNKINQLRAESPLLFWYVASHLAFVAAAVLLPESVTDGYGDLAALALVVYLPLAALTFVVVAIVIFVWATLEVDGVTGLLTFAAIFGWLFAVGWMIGGFSKTVVPEEHHHDGVYHRHAGAHIYHYHPDPTSHDYVPTNPQERA